MQYILIALVILIPLAVFAAKDGGAKPDGKKGPANSSPVPEEKPQAASILDEKAEPPPRMTRTDIEDRLEVLSESLAPQDLAPHAMCYDMAAPMRRVEYTCPKCGARTVYPSMDSVDEAADFEITGLVERDIAACRRKIKQIKGIELALDESEFCRKCSPDVKEPRVGLSVRYTGNKKLHKAWDVSLNDLRLIEEFLAGSDKHSDKFGRETPLKGHLGRLQELLGIKIKGGPEPALDPAVNKSTAPVPLPVPLKENK